MTDTPTRVNPVRCHICSALIPDLADDRRKHVGLHQSDRKAFEALRRQLIEAKDAAATAADEARQIRVNLENDITALREYIRGIEPTETEEGLAINAWPEDEIDDNPQSQYIDDITPPATLDQPAAGEPAEHPTDADGYFTGPVAIDRDDTEPTPRIGFMQ